MSCPTAGRAAARLLGISYVALVMVASYPPPGHSHRPTTVLRSSLKLPLKLAGEPTYPPQIVRVSSPTSHTYSRATPPKGPGSSLLKKEDSKVSFDASYPMYSVPVIFRPR